MQVTRGFYRFLLLASVIIIAVSIYFEGPLWVVILASLVAGTIISADDVLCCDFCKEAKLPCEIRLYLDRHGHVTLNPRAPYHMCNDCYGRIVQEAVQEVRSEECDTDES